jgi:redox-sensitive bicupin YhaK (pirin superfamily)
VSPSACPGIHTRGLQTISWLFAGQVEHRDSAGHHALIRPGELNLMTAGRGTSHAEVSTSDTTVLHGAQLWVALPSGERFADPAFEQYVPDIVRQAGFEARVFLGTLLGSMSPAAGHSPLVGAEITIEPGHTAHIPVDATFEHGVLVDTGTVTVDGTDVTRVRWAMSRRAARCRRPSAGGAAAATASRPCSPSRQPTVRRFAGHLIAFRRRLEHQRGQAVQ